MSNRNYWLTVWSLNTWREFLRAGANTYGLPESYEDRARKIHIGDYLLCYMRGKSEFFAILEVTSKPRWDNKQIWSEEIYPVRVGVRIEMKPEQAIPVKPLLPQLDQFRNLKDLSNPKCWGNHFHRSLIAWSYKDGTTIVDLLKAACNATEQAHNAEHLIRTAAS